MAELYRKVWAPNGTSFEVPPERAAQLVLNEGWSNTPPQADIKKKTKKTSKKVEETAAPAADNTEIDEAVDGPHETGE
jgi:hypothetical protein